MQYNLDKPIEILTHIGDGKFEATLTNGLTDEVNTGVTSLILFIYFENEPLPPIGWSVTLEKIHIDYISKIDNLNKNKNSQFFHSFIGYSAIELKEHIESQFTDGMTWDNYGEWHIDHIIGVINWDKNTHTSIVNALSNLRPLWATTREINGVIYEGNLNRIKFQ